MSLTDAIGDALAARGTIAIDPPVLQPAHLYFELAGEDLRKRAFLVPEADGSDLCLRPDMTIPACRVALMRAEWHGRAPFALSYRGLVFRRRTDAASGASEFVQAGAEWFFPRPAAPALEPDIIAAALDAARAEGGDPDLKLGDVGVFRALVEAADLPAPWGARLIRAFSRPGGVGAVLKEAANPPPVEAPPLARALAGLPIEAASERLAEALDADNIPLTGARTYGEIAARLQALAARADAPKPDPAKVALIEEALATDAAPGAALAALAQVARGRLRSAGLEAAIEAAHARWQALHNSARAPKTRFVLSLGRGLAYYDGFVFELEAPHLGARAALGGGGRYDGLIHTLARRERGAPDVSGWGAAGFALRAKRVEDAAGAP
jgi:ATP phosphoribosyltransferase regulatory subunit